MTATSLCELWARHEALLDAASDERLDDIRDDIAAMPARTPAEWAIKASAAIAGQDVQRGYAGTAARLADQVMGHVAEAGTPRIEDGRLFPLWCELLGLMQQERTAHDRMREMQRTAAAKYAPPPEAAFVQESDYELFPALGDVTLPQAACGREFFDPDTTDGTIGAQLADFPNDDAVALDRWSDIMLAIYDQMDNHAEVDRETGFEGVRQEWETICARIHALIDGAAAIPTCTEADRRIKAHIAVMFGECPQTQAMLGASPALRLAWSLVRDMGGETAPGRFFPHHYARELAAMEPDGTA